jgi:branched-subunit amino acid permease
MRSDLMRIAMPSFMLMSLFKKILQSIVIQRKSGTFAQALPLVQNGIFWVFSTSIILARVHGQLLDLDLCLVSV